MIALLRSPSRAYWGPRAAIHIRWPTRFFDRSQAGLELPAAETFRGDRDYARDVLLDSASIGRSHRRRESVARVLDRHASVADLPLAQICTLPCVRAAVSHSVDAALLAGYRPAAG